MIQDQLLQAKGDSNTNITVFQEEADESELTETSVMLCLSNRQFQNNHSNREKNYLDEFVLHVSSKNTQLLRTLT